MNKITINLVFSGAILPVVNCIDGHQRVPLKPISDLFGLDWKSQKRKIGGVAGVQETVKSADPGGASPPRKNYISTLLGITMEEVFYADQLRPMLCVRVDRVAGFLFTINPDMVRALGNEDGADFLEHKHQEWLDVIHAYEQQHGDLFRTSQYRKAMALVRIDRMRDPALKRIALAEIGVSIEEATSANPNGNLFAA